MAMENGVSVCQFFKYGYCKFKMSYKKKHVTQFCDDEKCIQKSCPKRHPRMCKYVSNFEGCKLETACAYSHETKIENSKLEKKIDELINIITKNDSHIDELIKSNKEKDKIIKTLMEKNKEKDNLVKQLVEMI